MKYLKFLSIVGLSLPFIVGCKGNAPEPVFHYYVTSGPDKTVYLSGQDFDPTGIQVEKFQEGCDCAWLFEEVEVLDGEDLEIGTESVTIKVEEFVAKIDIEVKETYTVACCGDSLTAGHMWPGEAYPVYINDYANHTFNIVNCGENGRSITGYGGSWDNPSERFQKTSLYTKSLDAKPDVILLFLGTNDATGWANASELFEDQYKELIDAYKDLLGENTKFIMVVSPPTQSPNNFGIPNDIIRDYVNPIQRSLAEEYGMEIIDLREMFEAKEGGYDSFIRPNDGVHLSKIGAQFVAEEIAKVLEKI